jgi:peptidoglycan/xylan/chitin deacetylase (PgdA/CDA1 family)
MRSLTEIAAAIDRRIAHVSRSKKVAARNQAPIVSITFDDIPATAARAGADILEAHRVCGSFYVCGGLEDAQWENGQQYNRDDLKRLAQRGHEIGCHTYEHLNCSRQSGAKLATSLDRNQAYIRDALGDVVFSTFAYPYGAYGTASKLRMQKRFAACRGVLPGINAGTIDLGLLKAVALPPMARDGGWITSWLQQVQEQQGWLVLFTHDVQANPGPFGCTPELLAATIDAVLARGIEILTVKDAVARVAGGAYSSGAGQVDRSRS